MKKVLFLAMCMLCSTFANAQTVAERLSKGEEHVKNLQTLIANYPNNACGNETIDGVGQNVYDAAIAAVASSAQLDSMYYRQIGTTKDGITDVTIKKPTLDEWTQLLATVTTEAAALKQIADNVQNAGNEASSLAEQAKNTKNPLKAGKMVKMAKAATVIMEFANKATPILADETANQVSAVKTIIETLQSGKNL